MTTSTILITGASSGIGRETAFRFAREGWGVILTYFRGRSRGEKAEAKCRALGASRTMLLHLDITDDRSRAAAVASVGRRLGKVDVLVNNAGVAALRPFRKQTPRDIDRQVRTNLLGLVSLTHALLPRVRKGIINIASAAGEEAYTEMSTYCGTKFGVRGFTQSLAMENPKLRIGCVNPDQTATRLSGYVGRPPAEVAEVVYRTVIGTAAFNATYDVDVWEIIP